MLFTDLLRSTVLLIGATATVLAAATVIATERDETVLLIVTGAWWTIAAGAGLYLGRRSRKRDSISRLLAGARTSTILPSSNPSRLLLQRLWPIGVFAVAAGGLALVWPQVGAIGAGYALLWALAWRNHEAAVTGVEDRDGVRFYVEPSSAFQPLHLTRSPGLRREADPEPAA